MPAALSKRPVRGRISLPPRSAGCEAAVFNPANSPRNFLLRRDSSGTLTPRRQRPLLRRDYGKRDSETTAVYFGNFAASRGESTRIYSLTPGRPFTDTQTLASAPCKSISNS